MYKRLKGIMAEKGCTQGKLAKDIGMNASTLSLKMSGKFDFTLTEAKKIAEILGKSVDEIFFTS